MNWLNRLFPQTTIPKSDKRNSQFSGDEKCEHHEGRLLQALYLPHHCQAEVKQGRPREGIRESIQEIFHVHRDLFIKNKIEGNANEDHKYYRVL